MRWLGVICVSVLWDTVSLLPARKDNDQRNTECCPCPKGSGRSVALPESRDWSDPMDQSASSMTGVRSAADCPCRDVDSLGASSLMFPAMRAMKPYVSLKDSKEDLDPLLHPEVNLASSVLETLRTATNEEYEEALARDAARSASPSYVDGLAAESGKNLVTFILNPKDAVSRDDDVMAEASHAHETRCVEPLGRSSFQSTAYTPSIVLTDILNLPRPSSIGSWNLFDMDSNVGASSINQQVIEPSSKEYNILKPKVASSLLDLSMNHQKEAKPMDVSSILKQALNRGSDLNLQTSIFPKLTETKKSSTYETPSLANLIPKLNTPNFLPSQENDGTNKDSGQFDSNNEASLLNERFSGFGRGSHYVDMQSLNTHDNADSIKKFQLPFTKTETQATNNETTKLHLPFIKIQPNNRDAVNDLWLGILKDLEKSRLSSLPDMFKLRKKVQPSNFMAEKEKVEEKVENTLYTTEILDVMPSPSEIQTDHVSFEEVRRQNVVEENANEGVEEDDEQQILDDNPMKTEILDSLPKSKTIEEDEGDINQEPSTNSECIINQETSPQEKSQNSIAKDEISVLNNEMGQLNDDNTIDDTNERENSVNSDSFGEASNKELNVETSTVNDSFDKECDISGIQDNTANTNSLSEKTASSPLLQIRERFKNALDKLNVTPNVNPTVRRLNTKNRSDANHVNDSPANKNLYSPLRVNEKSNAEISNKQPKVDIEDLQYMSDSLLDQENKIKEFDTQFKSGKENTFSKIDKPYETNKVFRNGELDDAKQFQTNNKQNNNDIISNNGQLSESDSSIINGDMKEEASEKFSEATCLENAVQPTFKQSILQPISLSDLNFPIVQALDITKNPFSLTLPNIFESRDETHDLFPTDNNEVEETNMSEQSMSPSSSSFRSALPPMQPLQDINLDLLQLNPLGTEMSLLPKLNLNSFKTRLAIPETLQLKPVILESSVGNKEGVIGATLTLGNDMNKLGLSNMLEQASLKEPNILGRPFGLLSLDDIRDSIWENAQNLFSTPLETTSRNVVEDTLRSGQVLTENLRVDAENTMKGIHKNLKSAFNGAHTLGNTFKNPNEFFEELSRRHEDVNDRLKGIHYDLSDRLESLRNNIFDQYRMPLIGSNIFEGISSSGSSRTKPSSAIKSKQKSKTLSRKSKTLARGSNINIKSLNNNKLRMPAASTDIRSKTIEIPKFRTSDSAIFKTLRKEPNLSIPQLFPKDKSSLNIIPEKNTFESNIPFFKKQTIPKFPKSKVKISFSSTPSPLKKSVELEDLVKSKLGKENSGMPRSLSRDKIVSRLHSLRDSSSFASEPVSVKIKLPLIKPSTRGTFDKIVSPKTAELDNVNKKEGNVLVPTTTKPGLQIMSKPKPPTLNNPLGSGSQQSNTDVPVKPKAPLVFGSATDKVKIEPLQTSQPLSWPRSIDEEFLKKVREAVRARLSGISHRLKASTNSISDPTHSKSIVVQPNHFDMERSASNNINVVKSVTDTMKEKTSYTCNMMCTKNTLT